MLIYIEMTGSEIQGTIFVSRRPANIKQLLRNCSFRRDTFFQPHPVHGDISFIYLTTYQNKSKVSQKK